MVGIVLVSHSRSLALSVQELVRAMTGSALPLAVAAGVGDDHKELGTDAVEIAEAIVSVRGEQGVLVLMDMGSAILSSETALDLLDESVRGNIRFCAAPFVEGAVAAGVTANLGASLDEVAAEAIASLGQKQNALHAGGNATGEHHGASNSHVANGHGAEEIESIRVTISNTHGLHARPAARLISEMRSFHSNITVRNLSNRRGPVSAKSLSGLATLEILHGNEIEFCASGDDAAAALEKITRLAGEGFGESVTPRTSKSRTAKPSPAPPSPRNANPVAISGGIAIGPSVFFHQSVLEISQDKAKDIAAELDRLRDAIATTEKDLENRRSQMTHSVGKENAEIYEAQRLALQDPELVENAMRLIRDEHCNAAQAWDRANRKIIGRYEALSDAYLRERAADLEDVGRQVLELLAAKKSSAPTLHEAGIVVADNLTPLQVSTLPRKLVLGVVLLDGGPTAHASILIRAMGIPAFVQARGALAGADWNRPNLLALDGAGGKVWLNPEPNLLDGLRQRQKEQAHREAEERDAGTQPAATLDGHRVEIFANIGQASEVGAALQSGAEGVGLLRTEFLFLDRASAPTEQEQTDALVAIGKLMEDKPLIVRTLDAGGDKELPYLQREPEENPFLGVRAIRLCFAQEGLFETQLRAILRAGHGRDIRIMFPMIANTGDLDRAIDALGKAHRDLEKDNVAHLWPVKTGIMIEIPSAAIQAETMARQADFFSIGTNDLTQYTLAADRGNPELASYQDALHPSVLRLIEMVVNGAHKHERMVAVCGEAASDERAAAVFVGLGVDELSLTGAKIPHIKACLRKQSLATLQKLAHSALHCHTAAEVRALTTGT